MSKYLSFVPLSMYNIAAFLRSQLFLLPVLLFFYQENGLTVGDFYLIQGLIVFFALSLIHISLPIPTTPF